jgi:hypothetical protein
MKTRHFRALKQPHRQDSRGNLSWPDPTEVERGGVRPESNRSLSGNGEQIILSANRQNHGALLLRRQNNLHGRPDGGNRDDDLSL